MSSLHQIECPHCKHIFTHEDDYGNGKCPSCQAQYYWDYVLDEETYEEMFDGYYFDYKGSSFGPCSHYINVPISSE